MLAIACGGEVAPAPDASAPRCGAPANDPGGAVLPRGDTIAFAIRRIYLGDTDRNGVPNQAAWRAFGYDIDGLTTTRETSGSCVLASGAARSSGYDGECGTDNSFGSNIVPILLTTFGQDYSAKLDASIAAGGLTDILVVDARAISAGGVAPAALLNGAALGHAPAWDGTDEWPIDSTSFDAGDALVTFARAYVIDGTWVGAPRSGAGAITLGTFHGYPFRLPVGRLLVTMRIAPDGKTATGGVISGVVRVEPFIRQLEIWQGVISSSLCDRRCVDVCYSPREASDILADGTVDPTRPCDAISIGIGFEASAVKLGPTLDVAPVPDLCAVDGGSDAQSDR